MAIKVKPEDVHLLSPKEVLEYGQQFIGRETRLIWARYPVEHDAIMRWCHSTNDTNPLYLDPEYAKKTKFGKVVCPPLFVEYFASPGPRNPAFPPAEEEERITVIPGPPPNSPRQHINTGTEFEFYHPVVVGDHLAAKNRIIDVFMRPISQDPECIWVVTGRVISNQHGEVVCIAKNIMMSWRKPVKKAA